MSVTIPSLRGAIAVPGWAKNELWRKARALPSLDLRFADSKSLVDARTGQNLVTFTRASSGTFVGSDGLIATASTDVPRFDHNPTTGESLGLLVEEQRTNLLSHSQEMHASPWGLAAATAVANDGVAPDGTITADKIVSTGGGNFRSGISVANATAYTYSVFVKHVAGTGVVSQIGFERFGSTPLTASISVNLIAGTITNNGAPVTASSIARYPSDWYRVSVTATSTDVTTTIVNYAGTSGNEFLVWGAQLEAGAFPTSYIKTEAAAATRSADIASITGTNFSGWYRQDEGTMFADFRLNGIASQNKVVNADAGTGFANSVDIYCISGIPRFDVWESSTAQAQLSPLPNSSIGVNTDSKTTGAYKLNDFAATRTGGTLATDTSGIIPTTLRLVIGNQSSNNFLNGTIRRLCFWPTRLANETLQRITQ